MPDLVGGLGDKLTAISDKLVAAIPGIEKPILDELHADIASLVQAEKDGITQIGETEKQVIDYALQKAAVLLNSQRAALLNDIDRRFVALGAILEALGQAMQKNGTVTSNDPLPPQS